MTEREKFEAWWSEGSNASIAVAKVWTEDACWFAWQASRRAALEEAMQALDKAGYAHAPEILRALSSDGLRR